jgi:hypothetical protein
MTGVKSELVRIVLPIRICSHYVSFWGMGGSHYYGVYNKLYKPMLAVVKLLVCLLCRANKGPVYAIILDS